MALKIVIPLCLIAEYFALERRGLRADARANFGIGTQGESIRNIVPRVTPVLAFSHSREVITGKILAGKKLQD
jgi:hypothetical protein